MKVSSDFKSYVMNPVGFLFCCIGKEPDVFFATDIRDQAKQRGFQIKNHGPKIRTEAERAGYVAVGTNCKITAIGTSYRNAYIKAEFKEDADQIIGEELWRREKIALEAKKARK